MIDEKLARLSIAWYQELAVLKKIFEDISEELEEFNKFGYSEFTFVVMGWIPKKFLKTNKRDRKKCIWRQGCHPGTGCKRRRYGKSTYLL